MAGSTAGPFRRRGMSVCASDHCRGSIVRLLVRLRGSVVGTRPTMSRLRCTTCIASLRCARVVSAWSLASWPPARDHRVVVLHGSVSCVSSCGTCGWYSSRIVSIANTRIVLLPFDKDTALSQNTSTSSPKWFMGAVASRKVTTTHLSAKSVRGKWCRLRAWRGKPDAKPPPGLWPTMMM